MQNEVAQRVTAMLSEKLGNHISMSDIRVSRFNKVTVRDLLVTDVHGDTILSTPELIARLNLLAFSQRNIEIRKVLLNRADIRLAMDPEIDAVNIKFIVDQLKSKDTTDNKPKWIFGIQAIELNDSRFSFKNVTKPFDRPFGMDYADLNVSNINLVASNFHPAGDSLGGVKFRIRRLSCLEKCGLDLKFLSADFAVNRNTLSFKNVLIVSSLSKIEANDASFHFDSFQDFSDGAFISLVTMCMDIRSSEVAFADLSHFVPYFVDYHGVARVSGKVIGTVENLKGENLNIQFGDRTRVNGNFDLKGLPNIRSTLIFADITDLETCPSDIERIHVSRSPTGHIILTPTMHHLSTICFKGNFTGFFDDFVTYGTFTTNLGNLSTDLSIKPVTSAYSDTTFTFRGSLKTEQFHLGKLLTQPAIGEITLTGDVEGSALGRGNIRAQLEGEIGSIDLKGYEYRNIAINGAVNNRTYDGKLNIDEPNIKMDFSGKVDLTEKIPAYDFWANVEHARLHELKLVETDTSSFAAFKIEAVFSGTNIDNLSGDLRLENSLFRRNSREIEINDLLLFTKSIRDTNRFILRSDIFDAEIWGQYQFLKLPESFFSMVKNFAPAWVPESVSTDSLSLNNFRFEAKFKDTEKLTNFFVNEFNVTRGTQFNGVYDPSHRNVHFTLDVPRIELDGKRCRGLYVSGSIEDSTFVVEAGCRMLRVNKSMSFENLAVMARAHGDSVDLDIRWNNWDSLLNKGTLSSKIFFLKKPKHHIPMMHIFSTPGQIIISGDQWKLTHQGISIDSTAVHFNNIRASMGNQEIQVDGVVSQREQDKLNITMKDVDLSVMNSSTQFDKLLFGGIANGSASLSNFYEIPVFTSDLHIVDFSLNDSPFGNTGLIASWNSANRSVHVEAESLLNDLRTMKLNGDYFISNQALNFDVSLKKIPVRILEPYVGNIFTGLEGELSGELKLTGAINNPLLNGTIDMQSAALTLDYTKTRYKFAGTTNVKDNVISFKNIELFDRSNNSCKITDGFIFIDKFKEISYDMQFQANNLEMLNTVWRDNDLFYGNAYATGNIRVKGNPQEMQLDITARTEKNTKFNLPLTSGDEVAKSTFITFVDHTPRAKKRPSENRRRRAAQTSNEPLEEMKFTVNINMEITPDAGVKLIFDEKIGDIISARGSGNLKLKITNTQFDMRGTYTVEEGDYLFTLRNVLTNKYFTIEKGGVITWNGDPMEALLNIKAIYTVRTSLYELMNDENFKQSVPVQCILHISNKLTNPNVRFELDIPNAGQEVKSFLNAATNSEEEMAQQIFWLLVVNSFYPNQFNRMPGGLETMGLATAWEILTNQASRMISQWSNDVDIDVSYRPGTFETGQNVGVDVTTNSWNVQLNYEVATTESSENMGDFTFNYKLGNSGKFWVKAFRRTNATYLSQYPYTQGVGFRFREDFNHIRDLFKRKKTPALRREEDDEKPEKEEPEYDQTPQLGATMEL